jgi:hypothetical protein
MCDFESSVSVWTHSTDAEWLEGNAGCTDVRLIDGISRDKANSLVNRLRDVYTDGDLEIRDIHNVCLWASDPSIVGTDRSARARQER